jgi:hypothetical protein
VRIKILPIPELMELLKAISIKRYFPPMGTAGLDLSRVKGKSRFP